MKKILHHVHKHVHKVREQPEHVRRHILHIATLVCGIILLSLWVFSLGRNFTDKDLRIKVERDTEPFSALKDNLVGGYESITTETQ